MLSAVPGRLRVGVLLIPKSPAHIPVGCRRQMSLSPPAIIISCSSPVASIISNTSLIALSAAIEQRSLRLE